MSVSTKISSVLCHIRAWSVSSRYVILCCDFICGKEEERQSSSFFGEKIGRSLIFTFELSTPCSCCCWWNHAFNKMFHFLKRVQSIKSLNFNSIQTLKWEKIKKTNKIFFETFENQFLIRRYCPNLYCKLLLYGLSE